MKPNSRRFLLPLAVCVLASPMLSTEGAQAPAQPQAGLPTSSAVDPLVKASAYGEKAVWSYHSKDPLPRDFGSLKVAFSGDGVRSVGKVPAPGVHPRMFFSPEDLPELRRRIKEDRGAQEAYKNILAWANALKLTYDENASYAKPDWVNGAFHNHGRIIDLHRIGGYNPTRENYFAKLVAGEKPKQYEKSASGFFPLASTEAFRCLIEDDAAGAKTLARAVVNAVKFEQERRAAEDKPVQPGQPPNPSTSRIHACGLGYIYDFIHCWMTPEQRKIVHDELVTTSAWHDNYGAFNNAEGSRSNWAGFSYWFFDLMAIEGEPGFNDLKFLGLYRSLRNLYNYAFFDSGASYEAEGKLLFGIDGVVAFDRVAPKYGLELLSHHPMLRNHFTKFTALSTLPTLDSFAVFDILGSMGRGPCVPQDLMTAKYLYPGDKALNFAYRAMVGDDYKNLPSSLHNIFNGAITAAVFATSYDPEIVPEKLNLPLSFFCGQRALMMTRSSWDKNATMLTMHVRGASGGHPYPDRNGIMLSGQGRTWVTIPFKNVGGWACNTLLIDEAEQTESTPARVVDYVDQPGATFMTGDAKYCWDWVWTSRGQTKDGKPCTLLDVTNNNVDAGAGWKLVEQSFNDFAFTKSDQLIYKRPLKIVPSWLAVDGIYDSKVRQVNMPVLRAFRTAGIVRGPRPYVLVVDDAERDGMVARYDWNLTLPGDVVELKQNLAGRVAGDILLTGTAGIGPDGSLKAGEPALLVRVLQASGERLPTFIGVREKHSMLSIRTKAPAPNFKVLLYAFRAGDPLPVTVWSTNKTAISVQLPGQADIIRFAMAASGKTDLAISRNGAEIAKVNRPVVPLGDPDSDALTARLKSIPAKMDALRRRPFNPAKQPGFLAGWRFDKIQNGSFAPLPGSIPAAAPVPAAEVQMVEALNGRQAARATGKQGLNVPVGFETELKNHPFTFAFWVKTKSNPPMGCFFNYSGVKGCALDIVQGSLRLNALGQFGMGGGNASSMLSSWTHLAVTYDGSQLVFFRNGYPLMTISAEGRKVGWAKQLSIGGSDLEAAVGNLYLYNTALKPEAIESCYLSGMN